MSIFKKATREKTRGRIAFTGPSGSGKTFSAFRAAFAYRGQETRVAVIDSEHKSASKYEGEIVDGIEWKFDAVDLGDEQGFSPTTYTNMILEAGKAGYDVLIIDSLSHAWMDALEMVDRLAQSKGNSFTAWKDVTPMHAALVEAILKSPCHVIATMRAKTEYVMEPDEKGKMVPRKVGLAPVMRSGIEYEFDLVVDFDITHIATVTKTRCPFLDNAKTVKPGAMFFKPFYEWLETGSRGLANYATTAADLKTINQNAASICLPKAVVDEINAIARPRFENLESFTAFLEKNFGQDKVNLLSGQQAEMVKKALQALPVLTVTERTETKTETAAPSETKPEAKQETKSDIPFDTDEVKKSEFASEKQLAIVQKEAERHGLKFDAIKAHFQNHGVKSPREIPVTLISDVMTKIPMIAEIRALTEQANVDQQSMAEWLSQLKAKTPYDAPVSALQKKKDDLEKALESFKAANAPK